MTPKTIERNYRAARERYAEFGVDTDSVLRQLKAIKLSIHCWQGDDVCGFERSGALDGGIQATGNYPGKARTPDELRADLDLAFSLIPGRHRVNLHAIYAETGGKKVRRDELAPEHFDGWISWAGRRKLGMDFNGTFFSHPMAASGFTLSSRDESVRRFWIRHARGCRRIAAAMARKLGSPSVVNVWIPDGSKDIPADRRTPREILRKSLDEIFAERISPKLVLDAVEGKLFGIGSESYVVGSHDFYLGYAVANNKLICLDSGHFHPTESVPDKISAVLSVLDEILLHVSRGVRWDSDHVAILSDELRAIAEEVVWNGYLDRVHIGLDYFDASINRVAAWVIGARSALLAFLIALLAPSKKLKDLEKAGDNTSRLALMETLKGLPSGAVWDYHCLAADAPAGYDWMSRVKAYERSVLAARA